MSDGDRTTTLRDAISPRISARDPFARKHIALALRGDKRAIARQVFEDRESLRPVPIPERVDYSDPLALERWRDGGPAPTDEARALEFSLWRKATAARVNAIEENKRRLRSSTWAEVTLRTTDPDYARILAGFHREHWRIAHVEADAPENSDQPREHQVIAAVRLVAG
jgi:hypothetical protein